MCIGVLPSPLGEVLMNEGNGGRATQAFWAEVFQMLDLLVEFSVPPTCPVMSDYRNDLAHSPLRVGGKI